MSEDPTSDYHIVGSVQLEKEKLTRLKGTKIHSRRCPEIDLIQILGQHLAEILGELGISQHRFAKAIGVTPSIIKKIIDGQSAIFRRHGFAHREGATDDA